MDKISQAFLSKTLRPHVFSLILVTIILIVISLIVYFNVRKSQKNKAPNKIIIVAEKYVTGVETLINDASDNKLGTPTPYIFTLFSFLIISNIMGLFGFAPPTTSFSVTITLGMVTWMGIYVIGIFYQRLSFFKRYLNPIDIIGQFSPLLSISLRIFGNLLGGSIVVSLLYAITSYLSSYVWSFNFLAPLITPIFHLYFDLFSAVIQAFVFTLLTIVYWSLEVEVNHKNKQQIKSEV